MQNKIFESLQNIIPVATAHGMGKKFVFLNNDDTETALTQFAYGSIAPGEGCEEHIHPTMDECFFFLKGSGLYKVGDKEYELKPESFLRIPAGMPHSLRAMGNENLEFVYFGVALGEV